MMNVMNVKVRNEKKNVYNRLKIWKCFGKVRLNCFHINLLCIPFLT